MLMHPWLWTDLIEIMIGMEDAIARAGVGGPADTNPVFGDDPMLKSDDPPV